MKTPLKLYRMKKVLLRSVRSEETLERTFHSRVFHYITYHFSLSHFTLFTISLFTFHFSQGQELSAYIEKALQSNPKIKAFEVKYEVVAEKTEEVNTLPNTQLSAGYFVSEPETRTGAQRFKVSVKQMLPWFGTISARENYATSLAEAQFVDIVIEKRKLTLAVAQSYYRLYSNKAAQLVLEENITLLKTYEELALTSVEVGKASAVDVLKLQIRQNEMQQQKEVLEQQFLAEQTTFNNLLDQEATTSIKVVDVLSIPAEDPEVSENQLQLNPELIKYDKMRESITQAELVNQKEGSPQIGFGVDYVSVEERPNMDFSDNGKDVFMPMVTVSIPIFNKKHRSKTRQHELAQQEITYQKESKENRLETLLSNAVSERTISRIAFETQTKNLKQAKDAEQILIKSYETGTIDFNDVLDIQELQLKFQMQQIQSVQQYFAQSAIINYLNN